MRRANGLLSGGEGWAMAVGPNLPGFATAVVGVDDGQPLLVGPLAPGRMAA